MTWDASKPDASQSPGLAPTQIQTNWSRLQAMISGDHVFNATAPTPNTDGYHKVIHWITQITEPSYVNGTGLTFAKDADVIINGVTQTAPQIFHRSSDGTTEREAPISPVPIRAAVSFQGRTTNGICTLYYSYNVTQVERQSNSRYVITFTNALPSIYYLFQGNAYQITIVTATRAAAMVSRNKTTTELQITCSGDDGNLDPDGIDLTVLGG